MTGLPQAVERITGFFDGFEEDLKLVGEAGAEAIVRTTLAGIGEDDKPFASYSPAYQATLEAVGGKARQTVDLRGIFYHEGQARKQYKSERSRQKEREGRRAYTSVAFVAKGKGVSFTGQTKTTRPQIGLTDPRSEMSLDLIHVTATPDRLRIEYIPREHDYMVTAHQRGEGKSPARVWFSARKTAVWAGMLDMFKRVVMARVMRFNGG